LPLAPSLSPPRLPLHPRLLCRRLERALLLLAPQPLRRLSLRPRRRFTRAVVGILAVARPPFLVRALLFLGALARAPFLVASCLPFRLSARLLVGLAAGALGRVALG